MRKKVGLALGAGSAKGFAHIGVLQALDEAGIAVDMISGSRWCDHRRNLQRRYRFGST
jgi:predicted acylesterase/phospholipase RssA